MTPFYQIDPAAPSALVNLDFSVVIGVLQDDPSWGAQVVRLRQPPGGLAVPSAWVTPFYRSRIRPYNQNRFTALGRVGKTGWLAYRVDRAGEGQVKITPAAYLPTASQVLALFALLMLGAVPAFLAPLMWWWGWQRSREASKQHLEAVCTYLEGQISA